MKTPRVPRKKPRQSRSQATVEAILAAAARIFLEKGFDGTSTNAVAECAGVSIGSLYQYFPNKLALLAALHRRHFDEILDGIGRACGHACTLSLVAGLRHIAAVSARLHAERAGLIQIFHQELPPLWPTSQSTAEALHVRGRIAEFLHIHRAELRVELEEAVFFCTTLGSSMMKAALAQRTADLHNGVIAEELAAAMFGYLTGHVAEPVVAEAAT